MCGTDVWFIFTYIKTKSSSFSKACKGFYGFIKTEDMLESSKNDYKFDLNNMFQLKVTKSNTQCTT